jgi:AcrR family transcriptional regulator
MTRTPATARAASSVDGRTRRSEKSREAIVAALFELVGEGRLQPTAQQVALRAGVGLRSVFRHFADMEGLFAAMDARLRAEAEPILREGRPAGTLRERALALVERRARLFERIGPYKRSGNLQRWRSRFVRTTHARLVRELRADLLGALPELAAAPAAVRDALELATSFEAWDRLRTDQRLSRERAEAALSQLMLALVDALPGARGRR